MFEPNADDSSTFLDVKNDLRGDFGCNPTDLGAARPAVASLVVKSLALFTDVQPVSLPVADLVDLRANRVSDLLPESKVNPVGYIHGGLELCFIFKSFPSNHRADSHDRTGERAAHVSSSGDTRGQGTSGFEDFVASHVQFFLQSCKNGLRSAKIVHIVLKRQFEDLFKQFFSTHLFPPEKCFSTLSYTQQ